MEKKKLGIIGGMGPQAMLQFCQRLIDHTDASTDQEHLPTLILNDTQMPDRTAALFSGNRTPVEERLLADAKVLESWGASAIAITCNTAHAFLPAVEEQLTIPVINMITETAAVVKAMGATRVGIMGTDGTLRAGLYHNALREQGIEPVSPPPEAQKKIMELIYDQIKQGQKGRVSTFTAAAEALYALRCDRIVLACTEMSTYKDWHGLDSFYVDAMDVLACRCIEFCGYPLREL